MSERERWAKYRDRPNLRQALLDADVVTGMAGGRGRGTLEHAIALGKRPCTEPYTEIGRASCRERG